MDDDFDIYQDLPLTCDIKDNGASLGNNENLSKECEELKKEVTELTAKLQELQKINETMEVNLSSLLKTAKAEIARKDKMIDELRRQVDDMSFKRGYFNRNKREINSKPVQQAPTSSTQELKNIQPESTTNLTIENMAVVKTIPNFNQFGQDQHPSDYESFSNKHYESKYRSKSCTEPSKLATTVFTERLRKKIMEEEEIEQKRKLEGQDKQNLLLENNHENNKEINIDDKENQSHFSTWNSNVDNTYLRCQGTDHDYINTINSPEDTTIYIENQQRLVASTKVSGKRTDNDTEVVCNKRRKLETEHNASISKDSLPRKEDIFNGYDDEMISNTSINKFDYKEDTNTYTERNDPHCNAQYERDHSRSRSNDGYYKRKEHYKKPSSDYNYSKEGTHYHEKDKYNHTRNRSPVLRHSDRKHKYHDDRYKDHRDKFDRRRNFHDKEETPIISNKKFYDLRHIDKIKFNGKYNSKDFYSPRHKESKYSDSRTSRSVPHERSKSGSRERTSHKIYDKRSSSKSTKTNNGLEKHASVSLKNKNEINELKTPSTLRKKDDISEKLVKTHSMESLESGEITDESPNKSSINIENKKGKNVAKESINVDGDNKSGKKLVCSKTVDAPTTNNRASVRDEKCINMEYEKNENNDQVKKVDDIVAHITTNVNTSSDTAPIPLDENKQDCMVTFVDTIAEKKSKCDEHIVQHQTVDKEIVNACDNAQNFSRDVLNSVVEISAKAKQENGTTSEHNIGIEKLKVCNKLDIVRNNTFSNEIDKTESNTLKNKQSLPKSNLENRTSTLNNLKEPHTVKPRQKNDQDNNGKDHVKSKDSESKKKSSEREKSKIIILDRRKKRVQLTDNNASMTIVITPNANSNIDLKNNTENNLKSRACKVSRSYKNVS